MPDVTTTSDAPVAIVTGGGRGMGAGIARELHRRGYRLALMSPSGSAETLAAEIGGLGLAGSVEETADFMVMLEANMVTTALYFFQSPT